MKQKGIVAKLDLLNPSPNSFTPLRTGSWGREEVDK
jgi:hypothetical protein